MKIDDIISDAPKRAEMLNMISHNGYSSCQTCETRGEYMFLEKAAAVAVPDVQAPGTTKKKKRRGKIVFPSDTFNAPLRDSEQIRTITDNPGTLFTDENRAKERKGLKGRSALADFANNRIDLVHDVQVDYMHNFCLGVGKDLVQALLRHENKGPNKNDPRFHYIGRK
jgi:hypothetical protein